MKRRYGYTTVAGYLGYLGYHVSNHMLKHCHSPAPQLPQDALDLDSPQVHSDAHGNPNDGLAISEYPAW